MDSLHTIWQYKDYEIEKYRLTHLLFANIGAMGYGTQEEVERVFNAEATKMKTIADEVGLPLISVNTSMMDFYYEIKEHRANNNEGLKIAGVVYALRSLFRTYYIASSFGWNLFKFSDHDVGFFAPFTAEIITTSKIRFYIGDVEIPYRIEKVKNISDWEVSRKYLTMHPPKNCGHCPKCTRTQMDLMAIGKLDDFKDVFNVAHFKKLWWIYWGRCLGNAKEWEFGYNQEIIRGFKQNHRWLPISSWFFAIFLWFPGLFVRKWIKRIRSL